jgi:putative transposase
MQRSIKVSLKFATAKKRRRLDHLLRRLRKLTNRYIDVEELKHLKRGKKANRSKSFRKRLAPWSYRQALARVEQLAQENRVLLYAVNPRHTSKECSVCGSVAKENRVGEMFRCRCCGFHRDADINGARNILARTTSNSRPSLVAGAN